MGLFTTKPRGGRTIALLSGIGIGAAAMYVLDPQGGRRRRAVARDKALSLANRTGKVVGARSRDLSNRAKGVAAEVRSAIGREGNGEGREGNGEGREGSDGPARPAGSSGSSANRATGPADFQEDGGL